MKIAHVVDSMEVGGAEPLDSQMCRLQRAEGHEPCVYAVGNLGPLGEQMRAEGFSVQANVGRCLADAWRTFFHIFRELHPEVVHLHKSAIIQFNLNLAFSRSRRTSQPIPGGYASLGLDARANSCKIPPR